MIYRSIIISFLFVSCFLGLQAQSTFKAYLVAGINAGQIDGDFEVGFNKIGATGGVGIGIDLSPKVFMSTEFLFSQRGSKNSLFKKDDDENGSVHLNYIELPIVFRIKDWYQDEDEYYKVWLEGGVSAGRLITGEIRGSDVPEIADEFNNTDVSLIAGAGYNITKKLFLQFRYTRSVIPVYKAENPAAGDVEKFLSYFLTLRVGYTL